MSEIQIVGRIGDASFQYISFNILIISFYSKAYSDQSLHSKLLFLGVKYHIELVIRAQGVKQNQSYLQIGLIPTSQDHLWVLSLVLWLLSSLFADYEVYLVLFHTLSCFFLPNCLTFCTKDEDHMWLLHVPYIRRINMHEVNQIKASFEFMMMSNYAINVKRKNNICLE